jgi:predicted GNAT family acetyltransferase
MTVVDNPAEHRFTTTVDGHEAQLVYQVDGDRLVLVHTEVPDELGGQGIGGQLVRAAVDRAESSGETIVARCPFAHAWLERHHDEAARATIDLSVPADES